MVRRRTTDVRNCCAIMKQIERERERIGDPFSVSSQKPNPSSKIPFNAKIPSETEIFNRTTYYLCCGCNYQNFRLFEWSAP